MGGVAGRAETRDHISALGAINCVCMHITTGMALALVSVCVRLDLFDALEAYSIWNHIPVRLDALEPYSSSSTAYL